MKKQTQNNIVVSDASEAQMQAELSALTEDELARAINTGYKDLEGAIHNAREHAMHALKAALKTGRYLIEVHRRCKESATDWRAWMKERCPELPVSTAYRYIKLAKEFSRVRRPEEIKNLRQAYIELGVLHEPPKGNEGSAKKPRDLTTVPAFSSSDLVASVKQFRTYYAVNLRKFDVATLDQPDRKNLQREITALLKELDEFKTSIERADTKSGVTKAKPSKVNSRKAK